MIFSRIGTAFRKQDWFVALIEIMVLVVGIMIGLQVDDWVQQRRDLEDEQRFLERLHADIETAEYLSSRVRDRRLERNQLLTDAANVLFGRAEPGEFTQGMCDAVYSSSYFNINVSSLPSTEELMSSGRLGIIRNPELRRQLIQLKQTGEALQAVIMIMVAGTGNRLLAIEYPDLFTLNSWFDPEANEARSAPSCHLELMMNNRAFLNELSIAIDRYDAYVQDGLQPWLSHFDQVHALLDTELEITH
jgi:hypothetical protein